MDNSLLDTIAIVGMAGRFPGAESIQQFWDNLYFGRESVRESSRANLEDAGVPSELLDDPRYVRAVAEAPEIEMFDAQFFGFSTDDATHLDPQTRMFLEVAHNALENAGYDPQRMTSQVGVYTATGVGSYFDLHRQSVNLGKAPVDGLVMGAFAQADYIAAHVAYRFGLTGPAMTVSTGCSSSAVAIHLGCQALRAGECDLTIAGGVDIEVPTRQGYYWLPDGRVSADGHCRPFDAQAQGTVFGAGGAAVVLKRLEDAISDNDHIWAVIRANGVSNDGASKVGFSAPSAQSQTLLIQEVMAMADLAPNELSYVEAHASGTLLGDSIEVAALTRAYTAMGPMPDRPIVLSSVKGNVGNLGHAAGVTSLIKVALSLKNEAQPGTVNFQTSNPQFRLNEKLFQIDRSSREWKRDIKRPRIAGLTSLGIGTNAHLIVQEAPDQLPANADPSDAHVILWSAIDEVARAQYGKRIASHLLKAADRDLAGIARTLQDGRTQYPLRSAVVASRTGDAVNSIEALGQVEGSAGAELKPIAFLFSGNESSVSPMVSDLCGRNQVFTDSMNDCFSLFNEAKYSTREEWTNSTTTDGAPSDALIFSFEYALLQMWKSWGVSPDVVGGCGIGEFVAAVEARVFDLETCVGMIVSRSFALTTASGGPSALGENAEFHPLAGIASELFHASTQGLRLHRPAVPMVSLCNGDVLGDEVQAFGYWARHLMRRTPSGEAIAGLIPAHNVMEVGFGGFFAGLLSDNPAVVDSLLASSVKTEGVDAYRAALSVAAQLWTQGYPIEWASVRQHETAPKVPMPGYPYQRARLWHDLRASFSHKLPKTP